MTVTKEQQSKSRVGKNPKDNKFYVLGYCGGGYWIPISSGFTTRQEAQDRSARIARAERAARAELRNWNGNE